MAGTATERMVAVRPQGGRTLIELAATRDGMLAMSALCNQMLAAIERCKCDVTVDLGHIDVVSSSVVATLVVGRRKLGRTGHSIRIMNLPERLRSLFQIHRLDRVFRN